MINLQKDTLETKSGLPVKFLRQTATTNICQVGDIGEFAFNDAGRLIGCADSKTHPFHLVQANNHQKAVRVIKKIIDQIEIDEIYDDDDTEIWLSKDDLKILITYKEAGFK